MKRIDVLRLVGTVYLLAGIFGLFAFLGERWPHLNTMSKDHIIIFTASAMLICAWAIDEKKDK